MQPRKWYSITLLAWLIFAAFLAPFPSTLPILLLFLIPSLFWYVVGRKLEPGRSLTLLLAFERRIPRRRKRKDSAFTEASDQKSEYFFGREDFPNISTRTLRILISTLGLSLFLTDFFPNATTSLPATPILFSIPILLVLPFILFPIWLYEDTGLRYYDKETGMITSPGGGLRDQLTGAGVFFTLASFGLKLSQPYLVYAFALGIAVILVPPALLAAVLFSYHIEPHLLAKFRKTGMVGGIPKGRIKIEETPFQSS